MSKLTYTVKKAHIDDYKFNVEIRHGNFWVASIFCDSADLSKYSSSNNELYLYDKDCKIIVSFYIRMSQLKGIENVDIKDYRYDKL